MTTLSIIGLSILGLIIFIGLIRVIFFGTGKSFGDLILDLFLIDLLMDLLGSIFSHIGDLLD